MHFIVRFFPEIIIKSGPVRRRFIKQVRQNLQNQLSHIDSAISVSSDWDKLEVKAFDEAELEARIAEVLSCTPGVDSFSKVQAFEFTDLDDIFQKTLPVVKDWLAGKTFCVRVKRNKNTAHNFTSTEVERYVCGGLNQHTEAAGVKLKDPDVTVQLEIKDNKLYVIEQRRAGLGGFPIGSQEPVLSLISGGFDSTVSSYMTIKRGMLTHYCFFNLGGKAHERGVKEVAFYLWNKFGSSHRVKFVTVPFEGVVSEILQHVCNHQMGVVLKRMMLRAASKIAERMDIQALVTGEAVAQVSSQTLTNLAVIDSVTDTLVLRPLITADKTDIIRTARAIGTEEFAASMPEYCGVISVKPTTKAVEAKVAAEEAKFDFAVLDKAVEDARYQVIDQLMDELAEDETEVEVVPEVAAGAVVIDIRHPDEEELKPLVLEGGELLKIPFFNLNSRIGELDKSRQYLLYCEKGVMSQLHAAHLKDDGFDNIGVYRPLK